MDATGRLTRKLRLGLALGAALVLVACPKPKQELSEVAVPDAGIELSYDLTPGQAYAGHVESRTSISTPVGDVVMSIEFDVELVATATTGADGPLVSARVDEITVTARAPEGVPIGAIAPPQELATKLNGVEFRFNLSNKGVAKNIPESPENTSAQMQALLGQLATGIQFGLIRLPPSSLKKGEGWDLEPREDKGVKHVGTGKFVGMMHDDKSGANFAQLSFEVEASGERKAAGRSHEFVSSQSVQAMFSNETNFPSHVERKMSIDAGGQSFTIEAEVNWTKLEKRAVTASPTEVQAITDPCDGDYVGAEQCKDGSEVQAITDPCDGDYVGPAECTPAAAPTE